MMLVNFHCHSLLSSDARSSMTEMTLAAKTAGIGVLCMTDHCDLLPSDGEHLEYVSWDRAREAYAAACAAVPNYDLRLGIELGSAIADPDRAAEILSQPDIGFVIGSAHNFPDGPDYCYGSYESAGQCRRILDEYLDQVLRLAQSPFYDVLGHLDYPVRYMRRNGVEIGLDPAHPTVQAIFRAVIDSGRGIECNTSGYRSGGRYTMPGRALLAAYRAAGGTRLTIGTDAHHTSQIALGLCESYQMLRELGFTELTIYRGRIPEQIKLEA